MYKYALHLNRVGNITDAVQYIREHNLVDDEVLVGMMLKDEMPADWEGMILRLVLLDVPGFNDHFQLSIVSKRTGKAVVRKPFEHYNNIKQLAILGACLDPELAESTIRSMITTLRHMAPLEEELSWPFWRFQAKQVQATYEGMAKVYSYRTVATKIGLLIKADDKLRKLASLEPENQLKLPKTRFWYESAHSRGQGSTKTTKRIRRNTYSLSLINQVLENSEPESAVTVLLAFKGVKASRNLNENEMGLVKVGDFHDNQLSIYGQYPRKIPFTGREMSLIRQLTTGQQPGAYLFRPINKRSNGNNEPLKRWALEEKRIKTAGQKVGVRLTYTPLRRSGQVAFAKAYLLRHGERPLTNRKELLQAAFRACQLRFGEADEVDLQDISSGTRYYERYRVFVDNLRRSIKRDRKTQEDRAEEEA